MQTVSSRSVRVCVSLGTDRSMIIIFFVSCCVLQSKRLVSFETSRRIKVEEEVYLTGTEEDVFEV